MKKILFFSAFMAVAMFGQAQIKFGVKAAANFTKFSGSDVQSSQFKPGFTGGGFVNLGLSETFSIQPELLYSMEGSKFKSGNQKTTISTDYVNIPVLVQYNSPVGFYAETGPQIGFLVAAKVSAGGVSESIKDDLKSINFSWGLGAGYKLPGGLGFGVRYNLGLANIPKTDDGESAKVKLGGFQVGVSYTFGGNKE